LRIAGKRRPGLISKRHACAAWLGQSKNPATYLKTAEAGLQRRRLILCHRNFERLSDISPGGRCSGQLIPDTTLSFSSARAGANPSLN